MTKLIDLKDLARFKEHLDERQATTDQAISTIEQIVSPTIDPVTFEYNPNEDTTIVTPLEKKYAYGVLIDHTQGPCTADITRIGNMEMHRTLPIHSKYRRCVWDLDDETILFHLADDNSNNGAEDCTLSASALATLLSTGKSSNHYVSVRVHTPKFYMCGKVIKRDTTGKPILSKVMWSEYQLSSDYREVPEMVTDFRPCFTERGDLLAAGPFTDSQEVSGGSVGKAGCIHPTTSKTRTQFRTLANNKNTYVQSYENYRDIVYWAFVIEYATFQSHRPFTAELTSEGYHQGGLGPGMTSIASYGKGCYADSEENIQDSISNAKNDYFDTKATGTPWPERNHGVTFSLGNHTGENIVTIEKADKTYTLHQNSYRGFEFPFGDIYTFLDGFLGEFKNGYRNFWVCSKPEQFGDSIPLEDDFYTDELDPSESGWYKAYSRPLWWDAENSIFQSFRDFQAADDVTVVDKYKTLTNGDLFPETYYVKGDEAELEDIGNKYYSNYWYDQTNYAPTDTPNLNVLFVGSYAHDDDPNLVGLGFFGSGGGLSLADSGRGCRCFNIIK